MGAKTPANDRETRPSISKTCEECKRDFQSIAACKAHTMAKHPEKYKQMQASEPQSKEANIVVVTPTSRGRTSKRLQQKKTIEVNVPVIDSNTDASNGQKTVFECPKCLKVFNVYFSALKHIQRRHCEDDVGNAVSAKSQNLIKPVRKELSATSPKQTKEDNQSSDDNTGGSNVVNGSYSCLGCEQRFMSVSAFDNHVAVSHSDDVDSMFFNNHNDFQLWKTDMETQVRVKYLSLSNTSNRQYYQCNYVSPKNSAEITHLCPSVLLVKDFPRGVQIHYYKTHYEHSCDYKIAKQFVKYLLSVPKENVIINNNTSKKDGGDLYKKLKNLLNTIIVGSAKINITSLKKLYSMALDMQTYLNKYDEDHEDSDTAMKTKAYLNSIDITLKNINSDVNSNDQKDNKKHLAKSDKEIEKQDVTNKSMSDDQITKVLEVTRTSARLKRKSDVITPVSKRQKVGPDNVIEAKSGKSDIFSPLAKEQKVESDTNTNESKPGKGDSSTPLSKKRKVESDKKAEKNATDTKSGKSESTTPASKKQKFESDKSSIETKSGKNDSTIPASKKQKLETDKNVAETKSEKCDSSTPVSKKHKVESDKNTAEIKSSLKENNSITKDLKFISPRVIKSPAVNQSPSFNDSYKQFIDSTLKVPTTKKDCLSSKKNSKKEIVKTKIGQFSPKKLVQTKLDSENVDISPKIAALKKAESPNIYVSPKKGVPKKAPLESVVIPPKKATQKKVSENVDNIVKKKKKEPIKSPKLSIANLNIEDVEYEVVEQENDCNILVLKI